MNELERNIIQDEMVYFKKGLRAHIEALQAYIDIWANDSQNPFFNKPEIKEKVHKIVYEELFGNFDSKEDDNVTIRRHLYRAIIRRFYRKIIWKR